MCSRIAAKVTATVLLVVGIVFVLGFLGFLIFYTVLLGPILSSPGVLTILQGGGAVLLIPQYFMVVSYIVGFILGLLQIYMKKRRWIDGVKLIADLVFLLSAGATVLILVFAVIITASSLLALIPGADLIVVAVVIGCYFSSILVWKCSQEEEPTTSDHQTDISNEEGFELK